MSIRCLSVIGIAVLSLAASADANDAPKQDGQIIEIRGKLEHGVQAIGAETTGTIVTTREKKTYELELKGRKFQELAEKLDGKQVVVKGKLRIKRGVEVPERRIIEVSQLMAGDS